MLQVTHQLLTLETRRVRAAPGGGWLALWYGTLDAGHTRQPSTVGAIVELILRSCSRTSSFISRTSHLAPHDRSHIVLCSYSLAILRIQGKPGWASAGALPIQRAAWPARAARAPARPSVRCVCARIQARVEQTPLRLRDARRPLALVSVSTRYRDLLARRQEEGVVPRTHRVPSGGAAAADSAARPTKRAGGVRSP